MPFPATNPKPGLVGPDSSQGGDDAMQPDPRIQLSTRRVLISAWPDLRGRGVSQRVGPSDGANSDVPAYIARSFDMGRARWSEPGQGAGSTV
jgi:hypothetical protein